MHPKGSCKCLYCPEFFIPDARNRGRQHSCGRPECRKASKAASQRTWLNKPENKEHSAARKMSTGSSDGGRRIRVTGNAPSNLAPLRYKRPQNRNLLSHNKPRRKTPPLRYKISSVCNRL